MGGLPLELTTDSLPQSCHMGRALEQANNTFKVNTSAIEQGRGDEWKSVPCYGFPAGLAEQVTAQYSSPNQGPQKCSLDELFAVYNRSNPITAWTCPVYFTVSTVWNLLLTDYFFQHVEKRRAHIKQVWPYFQMLAQVNDMFMHPLGKGTTNLRSMPNKATSLPAKIYSLPCIIIAKNTLLHAKKNPISACWHVAPGWYASIILLQV